MPRVSVIIPCYNTRQYLAEAIESVLSQTYADLELIVVDDGSTDNPIDVVQGFADSRIRYLRQDNKGTAAARNTGIRNSTGEFLVFLDADDLVTPAKLEQQVHLLDASPEYGVLYSGFRYFRDGSCDLHLPSWARCPSGDVFRELLRGSLFAAHAALTRRDCVERVGLFCEDLPSAEDWDFWLRLAYHGVQFSHHGDVTALYRQRPGSKMANWERSRRCHVQVLERVRTMVSDSSKLRDLGWDRCASYRYLLWALSLYQLGHVSKASECLGTTLSLDRSWLEGKSAEFARMVAEGSLAPPPRGSAPGARLGGLGYVQAVCSSLPHDVAGRGYLTRQVHAQYWVAQAFQDHSAGRVAHLRTSFLRAAMADPRAIANRGLASVFAQSFVGPCFWGKLSPLRRLVVPAGREPMRRAQGHDPRGSPDRR